MLELNEKILLLSKAIIDTFTASEWAEIGLLTGYDEQIDNHPRLLRSLYFGDEDYRSCVFDIVRLLIQGHPENLKKLVEYSPIADWLTKNNRAAYDQLVAEIRGLEIPDVVPRTTTEAGIAALADAQALLRERGPVSAVDRIHTGLHSFLTAACINAAIEVPERASPNQLVKLLLDKHPALQDLGPRGDEIRKILRSSGAIIDAMGTIRNQASLAHPNEELLDREEAILVINIARSLLRFLDAKFKQSTTEEEI